MRESICKIELNGIDISNNLYRIDLCNIDRPVDPAQVTELLLTFAGEDVPKDIWRALHNYETSESPRRMREQLCRIKLNGIDISNNLSWSLCNIDRLVDPKQVTELLLTFANASDDIERALGGDSVRLRG